MLLWKMAASSIRDGCSLQLSPHLEALSASPATFEKGM